ncbi:hypothetical protein BH10CYA1_BH10CYA1_14810 [soil metagenome]
MQVISLKMNLRTEPYFQKIYTHDLVPQISGSTLPVQTKPPYKKLEP